MTRSRTLTVAVLAIVVLLAAGVWYLLRPSPDLVDLQAALDAFTPSDELDGETTGPAADPAAALDSDLNGRWTVTSTAADFNVAETSGTFVGFRINEELSDVGTTEAIGRTPAVTGELVLDGTSVTEARFEADLTAIESDRSLREPRIQSALGTSQFPTAIFELTAPIELDEVPQVGGSVSATAVGELTIRDVRQHVEVPLEAAVTHDGVLVVTGSFAVALGDFGVTVPSAPIVVSAADVATIELQLYLEL